ncbi:MAG: YebC/PmpR family DNA-binding transcriptional regulator [Flavobacteriaceae bacterium]
MSSEFERLPKVTKNLNEEQKVKIDKLIDLIDEDDDVQNVYTNLE